MTAPRIAINGSASPAQAAAVAAAIESYVHDTARVLTGAQAAGSGQEGAWARAALVEGVAWAAQALQADASDPWINT